MKCLNEVNYKDCVGKVYKALMNYEVSIDD